MAYKVWIYFSLHSIVGLPEPNPREALAEFATPAHGPLLAGLLAPFRLSHTQPNAPIPPSPPTAPVVETPKHLGPCCLAQRL